MKLGLVGTAGRGLVVPLNSLALGAIEPLRRAGAGQALPMACKDQSMTSLLLSNEGGKRVTRSPPLLGATGRAGFSHSAALCAPLRLTPVEDVMTCPGRRAEGGRGVIDGRLRRANAAPFGWAPRLRAGVRGWVGHRTSFYHWGSPVQRTGCVRVARRRVVGSSRRSHLGRYLDLVRNPANLGSDPVKEGTWGAICMGLRGFLTGPFTVTSASRGSVIITLIPWGVGGATRSPDQRVTSPLMQVFGLTRAAKTPPAAMPHELMLLSEASSMNL